jgi:hypothetical protein
MDRQKRTLSVIDSGMVGEEISRLMRDIQSPDEAVRARAVRSLCPCRLGWGPFQECLKQISAMKKDPSPEVRKAALHVFQDSYEMESEGLPTNPREIRNEMLATRRRSRWRPDDPAGGQMQTDRDRRKTRRKD